ncbi:hypothetical protein [Streptomyces sp. MZ04]|uniref:hypothetical protein n=1 Tax=Streptomyces sp. MZ04 TaxID=2559236 RepID=UPI00107E7FC8|nr:hypothetical protein [Streptomyces sp. MZ04]TGB14317.1 hypothetical protein E2651_06460 [Streptomyces sp. MZ04]
MTERRVTSGEVTERRVTSGEVTERRVTSGEVTERRVTKLSPATAESGGMVDGSVGGCHCRPM